MNATASSFELSSAQGADGPQIPVRHRSRRVAKHRAGEQRDSFSRSLKVLGYLVRNGVQVSARVTDVATGNALLSVDDYVVVPTASVGTVLLLVEVAARLDDPDFAALTVLERETADSVAGSGIWQHLQTSSFNVADLATFVAATGDNLATNVLLRHVGLDAVRRRAESLGLKRTALLDKVRERRGPDDAPQLSVGSMRELTWLFHGLSQGEIVDSATSQRVAGWLSLNSDLSLVASAFGLDPHSHRSGSHGLRLFHKTGSDRGVRSECGVVTGSRAGASYAVAVAFDDTSLTERLAVLDALRVVGGDVLEYVQR